MSQVIIEFNSAGQLVSQLKALTHGIINYKDEGTAIVFDQGRKPELPEDINQLLVSVGHKTLEQVSSLAESELLAVPGIGHAKRRTINRILYANNLPVIGF